jgi:hypothetical protein
MEQSEQRFLVKFLCTKNLGSRRMNMELIVVHGEECISALSSNIGLHALETVIFHGMVKNDQNDQ